MMENKSDISFLNLSLSIDGNAHARFKIPNESTHARSMQCVLSESSMMHNRAATGEDMSAKRKMIRMGSG